MTPYGLLNFVISLELFVCRYGIEQLFKNGIYAGALILLLIYFLTGRLWYFLFHQKHLEANKPA